MAELLDPQTVEKELSDLAGWAREGDTLTRTWQLKGFSGALQVANVVGYVANRLNHHPDIAIHDYNRVTVTTTTHDSGGLTANDVRLASAVNAALTVAE
ncbi:4a-hydroxytetrahydrobiopterin dehydratase [Lipingzhangella halophila]|uniref:Putative pterin-4-alpha-carbinolamine dehydratase n=1 Tax=Lipingzhangella halophila TaxID=1783352 RepID=A0A7W7RKQ1_9ACTN|nr:4a-hydroxytetrahydrobiopterin dehydratase [Lipingzhangella halophila]MBB4933783.1 4a-hydroxytetrahydrobiopterin dehydratase [Lipingzhangella halophila]